MWSCICRFVYLYFYTFIFFCLWIFVYLCIYAFSVSMPPLTKCHYSTIFVTLIVSSPTTLNYTLTKKSRIALSTTIKGKTIAIIARAITRTSHLLPVHSRFLPVKFPSTNLIWRVLGDFDFS